MMREPGMIEIALKALYVAFSFGFGVYFTQLWIRCAWRGEPGMDWGLAYYVGSLGLLFAMFGGFMLADDFRLLFS